ncbi:MAG: DNRLRE domain-containing protein [Acidobacteria bacterium]|nr:DNRLRE domain-containing protein [Acidobacteriota bacterium]
MTRLSHRLLCLAAAAFLAAAPALATTVTFRQGENGYTGVKDTFLQQSSPGTNNGSAANLNWDADDPNGTGYDVYTLVRFNNIFGNGAGQVPLGSQITSASLSYVVYNNGGDGTMHEVLVTWDSATATFSSFCGGACTEGTQFGPQVGTAPASSATLMSADVTATVQDWSDGGTNLGWFIQTAATDGVDVRSSDYTTVSERPLLTIRYNEGPPSSNLVRQPYLQMVTPTSMTVAWRTDTATDSRVEYGTVFGTFGHTATNAASSTDHFVSITGLSPSTTYYYRVGSTASVQGGGTAEYYFTTAPLTGTSPRAFRFWIFGDSGICSEVQNTVRNSMLTWTASNPPIPDLFLHAGDVAQSTGADSEYTNCLFPYYTTVMRHTPFIPAMGNHDSYSTSCSEAPAGCSGPFFSTFVRPTSGEMGGVASNTNAYFSWDYGNAHFIVLNGTNVSRSSTGPMATWLRADLAATTQQWVIVYFHQTPYTKGTHDSDTEGDLVEIRQNILPILEEYGVDLVLNGHSHGYERSYLIDGTYSTPTPTFATLLAQGNIVDAGDGRPAGSGEYLKSPGKNPHEGTVYVVTATGAMGPGGPHGHPVMYYAESVNGSTLVDVGANELNLTFLRSDGVVRDTFTIRKGDLPPRVASVVPAKSEVITALPSIAVTFNMDVQGVDAADLTVNGTPAQAVSGSGAGPYTFTGYSAPGQGTVSVLLAAGGIESVENTDNDFQGDAWSYTLDTSPPRVSVEKPTRGAVIGALPSVTVTFSKPVTGVDAGDLAVNGSAATAVSGSGSGPYIFTGYAAPGNGLVTVVLAAGGIQDAQGQPFAGDTWNYALTRRLVINEFLSSNNTAAQDEYGEFDDYLEIYNPTDAAVDMSGMFLTDNLSSNTQYRIPSGVTVPAHGHIVFWCDSAPSQGPLHTNFNISRAGEALGLFDTEDNALAAIDTLTFTEQTTDVASGRFPDGVDGFVSMPATPGAANTISCSGAAQCTALTDACNVGVCTNNRCVAQATNEGGTCDDGVACTAPDTCTAGVCNTGVDTCPSGQTCNHGTGICEAEALDPLPIAVGETWRYFKGTVEPTPGDLTAWTAIDFDDAAWLEGASGFGFGTDCSALHGTVLSDMQNGYVSVYLRKAFRVDDPARVSSLTLTVDYDDAFVVYLNGTEVARRNVAGTPPAYSQLATADHECSSCNGTCNAAEVIDISSFKSALVAGMNVVAIQAHNLSSGSTDFTLSAALASTEVQGCLYDSECNDNNPCTTDSCNLSTSVCSNTPDNMNPCTDGIACTTDSCSAGICLSTDNCFGGLVCNAVSGVCESEPVTVTFQRDVAGYTGTQDTYLYEYAPDTVEGAAITWRWDTDDQPNSGKYEHGLIRFDGIIGTGAGQIPPGATISSATLTIYIENGTVTPAGSINEVTVDWSEATTTWNNFGGEAGLQADEYGTLVGGTPVTAASVSANIDVRASLQAWADGGTNYGWIFRPAVTNGVAVTSSEGATVGNRPKLTVVYTAPAVPCDGDEDCDDGQFCNGDERCVNLACQGGTPLACADSVACTVDSCDESGDDCVHTPNDGLCNDGNVCTDDTCDAGAGCLFTANSAACEDGDACTTDDYCDNKSCQPGTSQLSCDDQVACTTDSCNSSTGCVHADNCPYGSTCNLTSGECVAGPVTLSFQQGINSYTGTVDTYIDSALGSQATVTPIVADGSPVEQVLVRFDNIFGSGVNQIPQGSTISAATLTLHVGTGTNDQSANPVNYHRLLHPWLATDVWATFGATPWNTTAGIQADGVDALVAIDATATMTTANTAYPVTVTATVQAWANDPSSNHGWVILPTGTDGLRLDSSEATTLSSRPLLSVTFMPPVTSCTIDDECDDGLFCTGEETCNQQSLTCQAGTPIDCDDDIACTEDSCNEVAATCDNVPDDGACDDSNVCTDDTCSETAGCQHANNTLACDDGNACTTGDTCGGGTCQSGTTPLTCDDGVACTDNNCIPASGCYYADNCTGGLVCNHSTNTCETPTVDPLPIDQGDTWKYFKGFSEPTPANLTAWTAIGFDDSAWPEGPGGLGFDYYVETGGTNGNGDYGPYIGTELSDMRGGCTDYPAPYCNTPGYVSVYMRKAFTVVNPAAVISLSFRMYADDGYVAYLNGTEVARIRLTGTPPAYTTLASVGPPSPNTPPVEQTLDLTSFKNLLVAGVNVLALQVHNVTLSSRDLLAIPQLSSVEASCDGNEDCDDDDVCNGAETCVGGVCQAGTALVCVDSDPCTTDSCDPSNGCEYPPAPVGTSCSDGNACNGSETCDASGACQPGTPPSCDDGVACTDDACDALLGCQNVDACPTGEVCNLTSGICEIPQGPQPGDVIIAGFCAHPVPEWVELFNTTDKAISLEGMQLITRVDVDPGDGTVTIDWQLSATLTGLTIQPHSFFLIAESGVTPGPADLTTTLDLATGEGGTAERAIGLELIIDGVHMDHVLYGRHDGSTPAGEIPPGDIAFGGFPGERTEVIRTVTGTLPIASFSEGVTQRLSAQALYAGHAVEGFYTDEDNLAGDYPNGVWTSLHALTGTYVARNSATAPVYAPCDDNADCNDGAACTTDTCSGGTCANTDNCGTGFTCNLTSGTCEVTPVTATFRQGANGYTGSVDTWINAGATTTSYGGDVTLNIDGVPPATDERQALIRFDNIFGDGLGQVPAGATITSATLTIYVSNATAQVTNWHRMLAAWTGSETWSAFGAAPWNATAGVQADGVEALATADLAPATLTPTGSHALDVTASVQAWAADPGSNFGWVITTAPADTLAFDSAEGATLSQRPMLSITYEPNLAPQGQLNCSLLSPTVPPGGTVGLEAFLENLGSLEGVRGYQTQLVLTRTAGSGTISVGCPGGITIDDARPDYLFHDHTDDYPVTNCGLVRASSSLLSGSVTVGADAYLSSAALTVSADAAVGSTFEVTFAAFPDSSLADEAGDPIQHVNGPACVITVAGCGGAGDCDDGNPCTDDACDAGTCSHTNNTAPCDDANLCTDDDVCSAGICGGTPISCDNNNLCDGTESCDPQTGCVAGTPLVCDDGDACDGTETCDPLLGCQPGTNPLDCNDNDACTSDTCSAGACQHAPSGSCGVGGTIRYYRESAGSEPSSKPTPNVQVDTTSPWGTGNDLTDTAGLYSIGSLAGHVQTSTAPKLADPRPADEKNAITSYDAALIARHAVASTFSSNQVIAGDVSGNGPATAYDAALVSQFAASMIQHFLVATARGSDWRFLRCDVYDSATQHNCTDPLFDHNPLVGNPTDNFYAILYGDASGNWAAPAGFAAGGGPEAEAAARDRQLAAALAGTPIVSRPATAGAAVLRVTGWEGPLVVGQQRELTVWIDNADGIIGLDYGLTFDPRLLAVTGAKSGALASGFSVASNFQGGSGRIAQYGPVPLTGSGPVLVLTVEVKALGAPDALGFSAQANEGEVPLVLGQPGRRAVGTGPRR